MAEWGVCMRCPKCNYNKSSVIDSRQAEDGNTIRRRRECENCHTRFTTFERVEELPLLVIKKDGTREQFSREKILNGIFQSAQKNHLNIQLIQFSHIPDALEYSDQLYLCMNHQRFVPGDQHHPYELPTMQA